MTNFTVEMSTFPSQNLMLISVFYQSLLFIGDFILLGGFKLGHEVFDLSILGAILFGHGADEKFISGEIHEC